MKRAKGIKEWIWVKHIYFCTWQFACTTVAWSFHLLKKYPSKFQSYYKYLAIWHSIHSFKYIVNLLMSSTKNTIHGIYKHIMRMRCTIIAQNYKTLDITHAWLPGGLLFIYHTEVHNWQQIIFTSTCIIATFLWIAKKRMGRWKEGENVMEYGMVRREEVEKKGGMEQALIPYPHSALTPPLIANPCTPFLLPRRR